MKKFWILSFWVVFDSFFLKLSFDKFFSKISLDEIYVEKFGITLLNYITSKKVHSFNHMVKVYFNECTKKKVYFNEVIEIL
jgi:hypothetical protein